MDEGGHGGGGEPGKLADGPPRLKAVRFTKDLERFASQFWKCSVLYFLVYEGTLLS